MGQWNDDEYVDIRMLLKPKQTTRIKVKIETEGGEILQSYLMEDVEVIGDVDCASFEGKKHPLVIISGRMLPE